MIKKLLFNLFYSLLLAGFFALVFPLFSSPVFATACNFYTHETTTSKIYSNSSTCAVAGVDGLDNGSTDISTANTAALTLTSGAVTVNSGGTLVVGKLVLSGGNVAIQQGSPNGVISIAKPLYISDTDDDGYVSAWTLTTATASGKRRYGLMKDYGNLDCNDSLAGYQNTLPATYYPDADLDGYTLAGVSLSTRCSSAATWDASTSVTIPGSTSPASFTAGTRKNATSSPLDCDDAVASIGTGHVFGTICTPTAGGSGNDGAKTFSSSGNITISPAYDVSSIPSTTSVVTSATPTGIAAGDEVILINEQGSTSYFSNVGNYEFHYVTSVAGTTLNLENTITNTYGTTSNSTLTGQTIVVQRVPNWSSVTVNGSVDLTAPAWGGTGSTGGLMAFRVSGTLTNGGTIEMNTKGYATVQQTYTNAAGGYGGDSICGAGGAGGGGSVGSAGASGGGGGGATGGYGYSGANGTCGGGGGTGSGNKGAGTDGTGSASSGGAGAGGGTGTSTAGSGGGGGYGTFGYGPDGTHGNGGSGSSSNGYNVSGGGGGTYGVANLSKIYMGSAGGDGSTSAAELGGTGGPGGGIIYISAGTITGTGATISSIGSDGICTNNGNLAAAGGGGGGAGGSIYLSAGTVAGGTVTATGGTGSLGTTYVQYSGDCDDTAGGHKGGNGGSGRIEVKYTGSYSGTYNPPANFN